MEMTPENQCLMIKTLSGNSATKQVTQFQLTSMPLLTASLAIRSARGPWHNAQMRTNKCNHQTEQVGMSQERCKAGRITAWLCPTALSANARNPSVTATATCQLTELDSSSPSSCTYPCLQHGLACKVAVFWIVSMHRGLELGARQWTGQYLLQAGGLIRMSTNTFFLVCQVDIFSPSLAIQLTMAGRLRPLPSGFLGPDNSTPKLAHQCAQNTQTNKL